MEGYYKVSNLGRIKSVDRVVTKSSGQLQNRYSKLKKQTPDKDGYMVVSLNKNGESKKYKVHSIVAHAFVDGWFQGAEVDHIDNNRSNNKASNLRWITHADNVQKSINSGNHVSNRDLTGSNNPNYGNHILSERYTTDKEFAVQKQSRPGARNGRAMKVNITFPDGSELNFDYIRKCAEFLVAEGFVEPGNINYISTKISRAAKNSQSLFGLHFKI